jgi:hypothetical protein
MQGQDLVVCETCNEERDSISPCALCYATEGINADNLESEVERWLWFGDNENPIF